MEGSSQHGLPESSHSSLAYMKLYSDGTFQEMRFYDKNHVLKFEIGYHPEESITGSKTKPVLHYHVYDPRFSITKEGNRFELRSQGVKLTKAMRKHFRKYFKGINMKEIYRL